MQYRLLITDIDGTLRPAGEARVPVETAEAVRTVQKYGVRIAIATGRGKSAIPRGMLRGIRPDYWVCAAGAQVEDATGKEIYANRMTPEEMYALVDFFEDNELPLGFTFSDGGYVYNEYGQMREQELENALVLSLKDGEDQDHHLQEMPYAAFGRIPLPLLENFQEKYGYLGLRFLYYSDDSCDILREGQDKSIGLAELLDSTGISATECVAVGDGNNDVEILRTAALSYCVQNGADAALAVARRTCPSAAACGVAAVCRELWPEAFAEGANSEVGSNG